MVPLEHNGHKPNPLASLSLLWKLAHPKINLGLTFLMVKGAHNDQRFMEMM